MTRLGHDAGDRLLQAVAQRLVKSTRFSDTVARLGGDEFAILLEGIATAAEVETVAATLVEGLDQPFTLSATEVRVSASIGVAFSTFETGAEALLSKADIAMYHAKAAGKNRFVTFQPQNAGDAAGKIASGGGYRPRPRQSRVLRRVSAHSRPRHAQPPRRRGAGALAAS